MCGAKKWRQRRLGSLLDGLTDGDVLIFSEFTRMARSTLQILEILEICVAKQMIVYITKQNMQLDGSLLAKLRDHFVGVSRRDRA